MASTQQDISSSLPVADIAGGVISELRNILLSGKYPFNSYMPGAWIMEDYTAVAIRIVEEARFATLNNEKKQKTN
ncbi:hypothetical protein A45J_2527 [hot springs metagenome]|uniref:Uncharacterized protein n=1 Tax=hot springs metagenome TaxID=433727 RepID=A0A5J4L551_9ZZZZ